MLILTRRPGETICLGESIEVTLIHIAGNQVKLGIRAPSSVKVVRSELVTRQTVATESLSTALQSTVE